MSLNFEMTRQNCLGASHTLPTTSEVWWKNPKSMLLVLSNLENHNFPKIAQGRNLCQQTEFTKINPKIFEYHPDRIFLPNFSIIRVDFIGIVWNENCSARSLVTQKSQSWFWRQLGTEISRPTSRPIHAKANLTQRWDWKRWHVGTGGYPDQNFDPAFLPNGSGPCGFLFLTEQTMM